MKERLSYGYTSRPAFYNKHKRQRTPLDFESHDSLNCVVARHAARLHRSPVDLAVALGAFCLTDADNRRTQILLRAVRVSLLPVAPEDHVKRDY